jgi:hypothetical protein
MLGGVDAEPRARPARRVRRQRGHDGHRDPDRGGAHAQPAGRAHLLLAFDTVRTPPTPSARHRRRHRAGGHGDHGPRKHPGGRELRPRRLPDSTPPRCCSPRSRGWRPGSRIDADRIARDRPCNGATERARRRPTTRSGAAVEGAQDRLRRHRPDRPEVLPARHRHPPLTPRRRARRQVYEIAERHDSNVMNVFHAGDGNLHPLLLFDAQRSRAVERVHAAGREIVRGVARRRRRAVRRARHRRREARPTWPSCSPTTTSTTRSGCATRSTRTAAPTPARCCRPAHSCADIQALRAGPAGVWG